MSWAESRVVFNEEALKVRAQFDEHKHQPPGRMVSHYFGEEE